MSSIRGTVVNVFTSNDDARGAVLELRDHGFTIEQMGIAGPPWVMDPSDEAQTYAAEGAAVGATAGASLGALWGIGIIAGVLPILGPAIAGGTLGAILTSAAAGATGAGLAGALIGLGLSKEEADYYESELHAGRTIVSVSAPGRESEAASIMHRYGGYQRTKPAAAASHF